MVQNVYETEHIVVLRGGGCRGWGGGCRGKYSLAGVWLVDRGGWGRMWWGWEWGWEMVVFVRIGV